jgi:hypothetical protein
MKKYIVIALLMVLGTAYPAYARWSVGTAGGGVAAAPASPCPSGTGYLSAWDGDYTSDTDKMCYNSKASTIDGTLSGGSLSTDYGESGSVGLLADASNEYLTWTNTSSVLLNESEGTICIRVYINAESYSGFTQLFEATNGENPGEQRIKLYFASDGSLKVEIEDDVGTEFYTNTAGSAITPQTWSTAKYTWLTGTTTEGKHKICVNATCTEDTGDNITAITELTYITLGERYCNISMTHPLWIDSLKIYNTYDATCE